MFRIDPNTVYDYKDLMQLSGRGKNIVYKWFESANSFDGPGGKLVTGKELLAMFERPSLTIVEEPEEEIEPEKKMSPHLQRKLQEKGIKLG